MCTAFGEECNRYFPLRVWSSITPGNLRVPPGVNSDVLRQYQCPLIYKEPVCLRPPTLMVKATNGGQLVVWKFAFRPPMVALKGNRNFQVFFMRV